MAERSFVDEDESPTIKTAGQILAISYLIASVAAYSFLLMKIPYAGGVYVSYARLAFIKKWFFWTPMATLAFFKILDIKGKKLRTSKIS
jgi:hypothetical protein